MKITLYTTHCPKCKTLAERLEKKNIVFETCEDIKVLISKGFRTAPMLEVDGQLMDFNTAILWEKEQ